MIIGIVVTAAAWSAQASAAGPAAAPSQSALTVSPAITEQILTPGVTATAAVRVTNITNVPLPIYGSVNDLIPQERLLPTADKTIYDASEWFKLEPSEFILQPHETKQVTIGIRTPAKASPGGHYATIYFEPLVPADVLSSSTTYLSARVGVLALMIVKGQIVEKAQLRHFSVVTDNQSGPVPISFDIVNTGNVHLLPEGSVTIRDWHGNRIAQLPLPTGLVMPETSRQYRLKWQNHGSHGRYTAQVTVTYGVARQQLKSGAVGLWVLPWKIAVTVLLAACAAMWFIVRTRSRWKATWRVLFAREK
jgi:hypothetical protein